MNTSGKTSKKIISNANIQPVSKNKFKFGSLFFKAKDDSLQMSRYKNILNMAIVAAALILLLIYSFSKLNYNLTLHTIYQYRYKFYIGFAVTILTSICSLVLSLAIGAFFCICKKLKISSTPPFQ